MRERFRRLTLEGFRSIRSLDLELGDITILVGANGSGKSNLISFFQLLQAALSENLRVHVGRKGGGSALLHYGIRHTQTMRASLEFTGPEEGGRSVYAFALAHAAPDSLLYTEETVILENLLGQLEQRLEAGHPESRVVAKASHADDAMVGKVCEVFHQLLYNLRVYHFHDTSDRSVIRASQELQDNQFLAADGANLAAFLYRLQEAQPGHYRRIVNTVRLAIPYFQDFALRPEALNPERIQLRWRDHDPDFELGTNHLSDGSLRAIALITALQQPEELLPSIILIDEPELGLHPSAVSLIASLIREVSSKRQVLVATQSPRLLSEFQPDEVVVTERVENAAGQGESQFHRLSREELGDWLKTYSLGSLYEMNVTGGGPQ